MEQLGRPVMWHASIDYLRATRKGRRDARFEGVVAAAIERIAGDTVDGSWRVEHWKWMGYTGWRLGAMAVGHRDGEGYLYQASGVAAQPLYNACLEYDNCSRLDVQITCWYDSYRPGVAAAVAARSDAARTGNGRPRWGLRSVNGHGGGDTCYVGTRGKRSKFLRTYDKWKESGEQEDYLNAWRFEAELTDAHAMNAYAMLSDSGASPEQCAALVYGCYRERGVIIPGLSGVPCLAPDKVPRDEGSDERSLRWLSSQVQPAIDKLIARGVNLALIEKALGLQPGSIEGDLSNASRTQQPAV